MNGKLFLFLYLLYIIILFIVYRFFVRYLERKKLKKKLEQEKKLNSSFIVDEISIDSSSRKFFSRFPLSFSKPLSYSQKFDDGDNDV